MYPRSAQENAFTTRIFMHRQRGFSCTHKHSTNWTATVDVACISEIKMIYLQQMRKTNSHEASEKPHSQTRTSRTGGLSSQTWISEANWTANANEVCIPQSKLINLQQMWITCSHEASEKTHSQRGQALFYKPNIGWTAHVSTCGDALRHISTANVETMLLRSVRVNALERWKRCHTHELM